MLKTFIKKEKRLFAISLCLGFTFTLLVALTTKYYAETVQHNISSEIIRFHVRANSDSEKDQEMKLLLKEKILEEFHDGLSNSKDINESREYLSANLQNIQEYSYNILKEEGYNYPVTVNLLKDEYFPTKEYGDISVPPGKYETLRIDIGTAEGNNWWCVMFPPLCYVDVTQAETTEETKDKFENILLTEDFRIISEKNNKTDVKIKFKILEFWNKEEKPENLHAKNNKTT